MSEYIVFYLKKEFLNSVSVEELKALFQLLRVQNSLTYHMTKLTECHTAQKTVLSDFQEIEETFILASNIREAMKQLFGDGNCLGLLENRVTSSGVVTALRAKETYYAGYKTELNLRFLDMIRNQFSFHLKKSIYDGNITDGDAKQDIHIAMSLDETRGSSIVYLPPVKSAIDQVATFVKENNISETPDEYLFNCVQHETLGLFEFVNTFVAEVVNGNLYTKKESHYESPFTCGSSRMA